MMSNIAIWQYIAIHSKAICNMVLTHIVASLVCSGDYFIQMVIIFSEWWSVLTTADHCGHIPARDTIKPYNMILALIVNVRMYIHFVHCTALNPILLHCDMRQYCAILLYM